MPRRIVELALALLVPTPLTAQLSLIPKPRELVTVGTTALPNGITIDAANADDRFAANDLADALRDRGIVARLAAGTASARVTFLRANSPAAQRLLTAQNLALTGPARDEGYVILSEGNHLTVIGATSAGTFYGAQTVKQLIEGSGPVAKLNRVRIRDWPAMRYRGLHDDLSRGPVPTLDFQKKQIRTFAAYKINVYSPYFEQTLSYANNPLAAPPGGAMSALDIRTLVAYARQYHI